MKNLSKYLFTSVFVLIAIALVLFKYWDYVTNPWTRDGQVKAEVIQMAPRVSGPIVNLPIKDNQFVKAGDLLFEIDPRTFSASLEQAQAQYDMTADDNLVKAKQVEAAKAQVEGSKAAVQQAQSSIKQLDSTIKKNRSEYHRQQDMLPKKATSVKAVERAKANYEVSVEERKGAVAGLAQATAGLSQAKATLAEALANLGAAGDSNASIRKAQAAVRQAELNLEFTQVRAPVDGYITNLNLRRGDNTVANQPALAIVDINSYWIVAFFKETAIESIQKGNQAVLTLMTYPKKSFAGVVDSIGWGISQQDGSTGFELLPNISPTFEWIRLAQRVPVRIHLKGIPEGVTLRVGTTASVLVKTRTNFSEVKGSVPK
jgi:multidrug resistance efflux pump